MDGTSVARLPAGLLAMEARCSIYEQLGRRTELASEAQTLYGQLMAGRWHVSRAAFEFQAEQVRAWLAAVPANPPAVSAEWSGKLALSEAADQVYQEWLREPEGRGRRIVTAKEQPVLVSWVSGDGEWSALLAPAAILNATLHEMHERAALTDAGGHVLAGEFDPKAPMRVERTPAASKLPWTLFVAASDDGASELSGRRWLMAGGLAMLVALLAGVSYVAARAAAKELAVARLQADFVAAVSHEFRTPLSSICQMAELLNEDRLPSAEHRRRCHEVLGSESSRLRRLVEGLLDFARMESGAATYRLERTAPPELVRSVVEEFRAQPVAHTADVRFHADEDLPYVHADCEALGRAVWNLLDNALKYSPETPHIETEVRACNGHVAIRVSDRGIGIPSAEQREIFRKFVRGSAAKTRRLKGTGIGLAMVRHIVEGHGGEIRLESEPGRGSTFTILLPGDTTT